MPSSKTNLIRSRPSSSASSRYPGSSEAPSISNIMKRLSLVASAKSRRLTTISGDISVMLIDSFASTFVPALRAFTGLRTNGSSFVPAPDKKWGSEVVYSGSGPIKATLSRNKRPSKSSTKSRRKISGRHQSAEKPLSSLSSSAYWPVMHSLFSSTFGTLVWLEGSLSQLSSTSSRCPSLSSSRSSSRPVTEPSSGNPSPSVSARIANSKVNCTPVWLLFA